MDRAWTENDKAPTPERLNNAEQCADPGVFRGQAADVQAPPRVTKPLAAATLNSLSAVRVAAGPREVAV